MDQLQQIRLQLPQLYVRALIVGDYWNRIIQLENVGDGGVVDYNHF